MDKLDRGSLQSLLVSQTDLAVTMYVPMHTTASPPHITENQIRFKNISHKAIEELKARRNYDLANKLEASVNDLHDNLGFWKEQTPGMLICVSDNGLKMYHLPVNTEEYMAIDSHFHLAPLLGIINDDHDFYVLELSEHNPRLLQGDMYGLRESCVSLPANIRDAIRIHEKSGEEERHPENNSFSHSAGYPSRFFKIIDKILMEKADKRLPLILAGTEPEVAEYRGLSRYPKILGSGVTNSYDKGQLRELFNKVNDIVHDEVVIPEHKSAIEEYMMLEQSSPERTASSEQEIFEAAEQGRIDKLFTKMSLETTDNVQDSLAPRTRITFFEPRLNSILSQLALKVWKMKGKVLNLLPSEMPHSEPVVAKLRY